METITRRVDNKVQKFTVFKKDENHPYSVHWKQAWKNGWAETDDGYVAQCLDRTTYKDAKGKVKRLIKLTCGIQWVSPTSKLLFEPNRDAGIYSMVKPKSWQEREAGKTRTKNAVNAYVSKIFAGKKVDWEEIGTIYRGDEKKPAATAKRLFKEKVVKQMVEEKMKEVLASKGINRGFVLDVIRKSIDIAENKEDVSNMLRAAENLVDMLEMKPNKKITTDTLQIDMTNQIADKIETEEKKMIAQRKTEI